MMCRFFLSRSVDDVPRAPFFSQSVDVLARTLFFNQSMLHPSPFAFNQSMLHPSPLLSISRCSTPPLCFHAVDVPVDASFVNDLLFTFFFSSSLFSFFIVTSLPISMSHFAQCFRITKCDCSRSKFVTW